MTKLNTAAIVNSVVDIDQIHPHPRNYTIHPETQLIVLEKSHEEFGQYRSVVVWAQPNGCYIQVAGHGYVEAARRKKEKTIRADVLPIETGPATIEAIMIADNQHQKKSQENLDILGDLMKTQQEQGRNLLALGSSKKEADDLFRRITNLHATDFLTPIIQATPVHPMQQPVAPPHHETSLDDDEEEEEDTTNDEVLSSFSPTINTISSPTNEKIVPPLPEQPQWFPVTYTVSYQQREILLSAIKRAKQQWNVETSAEAIVRICESFVQGAA